MHSRDSSMQGNLENRKAMVFTGKSSVVEAHEACMQEDGTLEEGPAEVRQTFAQHLYFQ